MHAKYIKVLEQNRDMAYLQPNHAIISERPLTEASCRNRCGELERAQLIKWRGNWKNAGHKKGRIRWKRRWVLERARGSLLRCASSSSSSSLRSSVEEIVESGRERKEYIVSEYGWGVRRLIEETSEMRKVAQVQAEAFYVPVFFFKELFFQFFQVPVYPSNFKSFLPPIRFLFSQYNFCFPLGKLVKIACPTFTCIP